MKNYCHLNTHVTHGRKPCEKGALHRELILCVEAIFIIHVVRIALLAGGVSLLPAVTHMETDKQTHEQTNKHTHTHRLITTRLVFILM